MAKEKHSSDTITEPTLHEILLDIKYRLDHLEDMEADNRALMVKLVKQNNSIVQFFKSIETEELNEMGLPPIIKEDKSINFKKMRHIKELIDEYMDKSKGLKELEEELKKNKDKITPGQIGES